MSRFLTGDELGGIKSVSYDPHANQSSSTSLRAPSTGRVRAVQKLAGDPTLLASAHADGTISLASLRESSLEHRHSWKETRFVSDCRFVGLALSQDDVYSCASNGALRRSHTSDGVTHELGALPSRLTDWRLSLGRDTFAYGGDEVEVSVWDARRAFESRPTTSPNGKKRKQREDLFPAEIWRARNVANDQLDLRQPVHNTCLTYLSPSGQPQILAGTRFGDLRRYDTRSGRRPVSNLGGIAKVGGLKVVEKGTSDHEVFVSDQGTNLFALDLRTGGVAYAYKGISGAVNSLAVAPSFLASVSLDRFTRIHSTFPPPAEAGNQQRQKGTVLDKVFMTTIPTVVIWDQRSAGNPYKTAEEDDGDVWEQMKHVGEKDQE